MSSAAPKTKEAFTFRQARHKLLLINPSQLSWASAAQRHQIPFLNSESKNLINHSKMELEKSKMKPLYKMSS